MWLEFRSRKSSSKYSGEGERAVLVKVEGLRYRPRKLTYSLELPPSDGRRSSVLAFAIWKSGSSLLYGLLSAMCREVGLTYMGVDEELFNKNHFGRPADVGPIFVDRGFCYGGFRCFPCYPIPIFDKAKAILLVRDPRDMLVSYYFSVRNSHILPEDDGGAAGCSGWLRRERNLARTMSVDSWVMENYGLLLMGFESYFAQGFTRKSNVVIYRYEDIIFNKQVWAADLAEWYAWEIPDEVIGRLVAPFDIIPDGERPDQHIRQVRPGNYKHYLSPRTQSRIATLFNSYITVFGY